MTQPTPIEENKCVHEIIGVDSTLFLGKCKVCKKQIIKHSTPQQENNPMSFLSKELAKIDNWNGMLFTKTTIKKNLVFVLQDFADKIRLDIVEMKNEKWIIHGMDCEEGRRPCGVKDFTNKFADRCEERRYDKKTLTDLDLKIADLLANNVKE